MSASAVATKGAERQNPMLDVRFIRSNTFRWAFGVACLFATFVTVLFAFIYFNIDDYLVARSDRVIMTQVSFFSALPLERRVSAIEDHLAEIPEAFSLPACSMPTEAGLPAMSGACPMDCGSTDPCRMCRWRRLIGMRPAIRKSGPRRGILKTATR
jgi:hypothetical protein